jgi:hypothetical protein
MAEVWIDAVFSKGRGAGINTRSAALRALKQVLSCLVLYTPLAGRMLRAGGWGAPPPPTPTPHHLSKCGKRRQGRNCGQHVLSACAPSKAGALLRHEHHLEAPGLPCKQPFEVHTHTPHHLEAPGLPCKQPPSPAPLFWPRPVVCALVNGPPGPYKKFSH